MTTTRRFNLNYDIIAVLVDLDTQPHSGGGRFSIPEEVVRVLNPRDSDRVELVFDPDTDPRTVAARLRSGNEIYGPEITDAVHGRQRIRVMAQRVNNL